MFLSFRSYCKYSNGLLLFLFQFILLTSAQSQVSSYYFRHLTSTEGLSDGVIHTIVQDKYGFIWIGTSYGLNRFDGISVKNYFSKTGDTTTISNDFIQSLYVDRQGNLWVGTMSGLCRFDQRKNCFVRYNFSVPLIITDIIQNKDGKIWVGTDYGFYVVNEQKNKLEKFIASTNTEQQKKFYLAIRQIINAPGGSWYIATLQGIRIFDPSTFSIKEIRHDPLDKSSLNSDLINSIAIDSFGSLWAACGYNGSALEKIDLKTNSIKHYKHFTDPTKNWTTNTIQKILAGKNGEVWVISSHSGISLYDQKNDDFIDHTSNSSLPNSLLSNSNVAIYQDRQGIIWLGTPGHGLSYFNPGKNLFTSLYPMIDKNISSPGVWCRSACEDKEGNYWLATVNGLIKYDLVKKTFISFTSTDTKGATIAFNSTRTLLKDDHDDIWIGTAKGLNRYHSSTGTMEFFTKKQGMPPVFFWMIVQDRSGGLWFGSSSGIFKYDREKNCFDDLSNDPVLSKCTKQNIQSLYADDHNRLWIGMLDVGLMMYDIGTKKQRLLTIDDSTISDTRFSSLAEDKEGIIWIGSENKLTAYDPVKNRSIFYGRENGLSSGRTNNIMVDSLGRIWIGTSNGLCLLDKKNNKIKKFDGNDGLQTNQFNEQAAYRTHEGLFIYPTYKGFVLFKPEAYRENSDSVPVYITSFKIPGKEAEQEPESIQNVHLDPYQNFFNIELTGLNYMNPSECQYAYKLEPFDRDWIFSDRREINYTNVPAGDYVFRYKVLTANQAINVEEKTINISIDQVYYKTTWFKLLILCLVAALAIAFFRFRIKQKEKILILNNKAQMLEKEKAVVQFENLKQQLNPHFLFNSLTSLRSLIRVDPKTATHFLDGLSKTYRYLLKSGEAELVTVEDELNFVQTFIELQKTRFKEGLQVKVNVEAACYGKYIVPVTLQNLIENAIKHNTTSVEEPLIIDIYNENDYITVKNNLQRYRLVETSNKKGLVSMKSLYSYLTDKPIHIVEDEKYFTVKIPLL